MAMKNQYSVKEMWGYPHPHIPTNYFCVGIYVGTFGWVCEAQGYLKSKNRSKTRADIFQSAEDGRIADDLPVAPPVQVWDAGVIREENLHPGALGVCVGVHYLYLWYHGCMDFQVEPFCMYVTYVYFTTTTHRKRNISI